MKPWRPKQKPAAEQPPEDDDAPSGGFFDARGLTGRLTRHQGTQSLKRVRINFVHNVALIPPLVGVGVLLLLPFILASSPQPDPPVGSGRNQVLLGKDGTPIELAVPEGQPGETRQVSLGEALYHTGLPLADRRQAARELGSQPQQESLDALLRAARDDDAEARRLSCYGLVRRLDSPEAQAALARLLVDDEPKVAMATAAALGTVERGGYLLFDRLQQPDELGNVHAACLRALHYVGTPDLIPRLLDFVDDPGPRSEAATHTVWMISKRAGLPLPPDIPSTRVR